MKKHDLLFLEPKITILEQIDKRLNPMINKFGCRFMSMLAIPQIINNRALTPEGIQYVYEKAIEMGPDTLTENCVCGREEHRIMNLGFELLEDTDRSCRQIFVSDSAGKFRSKDMLPSKENIYFFIFDFLTTSFIEYGGHHFMLANCIGDLIYDPGGGTCDSSIYGLNRWLCYKVFSKALQEKYAKEQGQNG